MYKKRWYDGLHDIYEGKDEFEIKFGCFGGDGGGGGSSNTGKSKGEHDTTPSTGFRGEQTSGTGTSATGTSATGTSATGTSGSTGTTASGFSGPTGAGIGPGETSTSASGFSGPTGAGIGPGEQSVSAPTTSPVDMGMSIFDIVQEQPAKQSFADIYGLAPTVSQTPVTAQDVKAMDVSLGRAPATTGKSLADSYASAQSQISDMIADQMAKDQMSQAQANLNDYMSNISNQGKFSNQPTQSGFNFTPDFGKKGFEVSYTAPFARGGPVQQGIGSIFPYPRRR